MDNQKSVVYSFLSTMAILSWLMNTQNGVSGILLIILMVLNIGVAFFIFVIFISFSALITHNYKYYKKKYAKKMSIENYDFLCKKLEYEFMQNRISKEKMKAQSEYLYIRYKEYNEKLEWAKNLLSKNKESSEIEKENSCEK